MWTSAGLLPIGPLGTNFSEILTNYKTFHSRKCIWKYCLWKGGHFVQGEMCWLLWHDDVIKWKHFPRYWPFVRESRHKGQWRGALMFSLICTWINSWVNNPEAGDLRRHRAHCDVSVMETRLLWHFSCISWIGGWVGLCDFLWAPSAKRKDHHWSALDGAVFDFTEITP